MAKQEIHKQLEVHFFKHQAAMLRWLKANHEQDSSIWIKLAKKNAAVTSVTYEQAREAAIIFGWIDGLINGLDESFYLIKFSPRRKRSKWSKINRAIAQELIDNNKMHPAGLAQVEAAQADGRWEAAYDSAATMKVPAELKKWLKANPKANEFFESLSQANRYAFLYRIQTAAKPETRQRHLQKTKDMLTAEQVYHPNLRKKK